MHKTMTLIASLLAMPALARAEDYRVEPELGNSTFTAMFDAALGERITANSSKVECAISYDEKSNSASGSCSVPLTSIRVDNEDTKTEHFQQWATNKKSPAKDCRFEATFTRVTLSQPLQPEKAASFSAELPFSICGRLRSDGGKERVTGTVLLFPAGTYGAAKTLRIRAKLEGFHRDRYRIGPKYTEGWFARVQSLAKVVAEEGTIELNLFAKAPTPAK